ncbi:MAG TPA: hypothetical protein VD788_12555 [Candidatus Polarisedimenticolaceae bacterium]|nr:hypothetical protein [Candidatus Polarisedimenticolaceae bacterium]
MTGKTDDAPRRPGLPLLLAVAAAAVYLPSLFAGFFSDDFQWLGRMNATLERPLYLFSIIYRDFNPVLHASLLLDWLAGRGSPVAFHAQSILIHAANAALLFVLCRKLALPSSGAAAVTLLWAWNVRISEAVIWPAARGHELATTFVLAAFVVLLGSLRWRSALALSLFVAALLTKETALMPMLLVPMLLGASRRHWRLYAAVGSLGFAFVLFNLVAKPDFHSSPAPLSALLLKIPFILLRPIGLGDHYDFSPPMAVALLVLFGGAAWLLRRTPAAVGFAWVALCTLPIIPLDKLSSRYLYMMAVGYALVAYGAAEWSVRSLTAASARAVLRGAMTIGVGVVLAAGALRIQAEIRDYEDLGRPYHSCLSILAPELVALEPGEQVVVVDVGPRDSVRRLADELNARPTITKLIPSRDAGVDGLIALVDMLNVARERSPGLLGYAGRLGEPGPTRFVVFDGHAARRVAPIPTDRLPDGRVFVAGWGEADRYFEAD